MNFADIINQIEWLFRAVQQDPMSFMVVYPMTIMTSSVLLYALLQDLVPARNAALTAAPILKSNKINFALPHVIF